MAPYDTFLPMHTQVDAFEDEDPDYEYEYETSYVTMDLGNIDPTSLLNASTYRLTGLDSPTPFLQLPGTTLKGVHEELIGSELIFIDDRDAANNSRRVVSHLGTTSKRIAFKPVKLKPRIPEATEAANGDKPAVPPPVLFQGQKKRKKLIEKKAEMSPKAPRGGARGRPRGKGRGSGLGPSERTKAKGKAQAKVEQPEDDSTSSGSDVDDDVVQDAVAQGEPGPSTRSLRQRRPSARAADAVDLDLLESLEAIDADHVE